MTAPLNSWNEADAPGQYRAKYSTGVSGLVAASPCAISIPL